MQAIELAGYRAKILWYKDRFSPKDYCAFILPGGFSYGDYLRAGALSAHAPALKDLHSAAKKGQPILGICNGFQILCEAGLLDGVLRPNHSLRFIDQWTELQLCHPCKAWGNTKAGKNIRIPMAHAEGCFYLDKNNIQKLKDNGQIWWKYKKNPNGSTENIAGIMNKQKNVAGLMPHPERAVAKWMGSTDGLPFFSCL